MSIDFLTSNSARKKYCVYTFNFFLNSKNHSLWRPCIKFSRFWRSKKMLFNDYWKKPKKVMFMNKYSEKIAKILGKLYHVSIKCYCKNLVEIIICFWIRYNKIRKSIWSKTDFLYILIILKNFLFLRVLTESNLLPKWMIEVFFLLYIMYLPILT